MSSIELKHISVRRAGVTQLDDIDLSVDDGELVGVLGGSGAGKTALLRTIAGLEPPTAGTITIDGVDVTRVGPAVRGAAMVFQTPALMPHLDVRRNIAFALELRRGRPEEIALRVAAESRAMHIGALLGRSARHLSAGEAQLVQVAKALVRRPSVLLLDEPLARLDASMASHLRLELRALQQGYGVTTFLATNDPGEAMSMPDRLVVLDGGRVIQAGRPIDVYERPANVAALTSTGPASILTAMVEADDAGVWLVHPAFRRRAEQPSLMGYVGAFVIVALRPAWMTLTPYTGAVVDGAATGSVTDVDLITGTITVELDASPRLERVAIAGSTPRHHPGDRVAFRIDQLALFDPVSGDRLA